MTDREDAAARRDHDDTIPVWRSPALALLVAVVLLPALLFLASARSGYRTTLETAEARAERTARILEEHVNKVFESHRMVIQQVRDHLRFTDWSKESDRADLHRFLRELQDDLDQVTTITIVDRDGRLMASGRTYPVTNAISFADRDWYQRLRDGAPGAVVSRAYLGRQSQLPIFNIAVPLRDKAGAFAGAIAVSIDRRYFETFYREVDTDFDHSVTLVRADGEILARVPETALGHLPPRSTFLEAIAVAPAGHYIGTSQIDQIERVFAYRKVGAYPVYVRFGISMGAVLAPWHRTLAGTGTVAVLSSLALAYAAWLVVRQTGRERRARRRWQETAAALEAEVAERERIDAQMRQMQRVEAIGRLTGGIAHDFNNLLTAVLGNLELAARRTEDARLSRLVANAADGAQRAAALTGRLLAFSRQQPLHPTRVDLDVLVAGMVHLLDVTLGETIALEIQETDGLWPVEIDASQLENAILNLAVNARDAMVATATGGGRLAISTANVTLAAARRVNAGEITAGDYVVLSMRDTGEGMTPDVLAQVFEPFFTTKPIGKGTGLGLSQVYGFARQSGGEVAIESTPGLGTTIQLFLPRFAGKAEIAADDAAGEAADCGVARGETILVVEDEAIVRSFATAALREAGWRVLEASDGPAALTLLAAHPEVALLFTDLALKGPLHGRDLARAAGRHRPIAVLFTSGHGRDAMVAEERLDPEAAFLQKPYASADLTSRVRRVLDDGPRMAPRAVAV